MEFVHNFSTCRKVTLIAMMVVFCTLFNLVVNLRICLAKRQSAEAEKTQKQMFEVWKCMLPFGSYLK